jgi:hypothetical protein
LLKFPKNDDARVRDLEEHLAEALQREAGAVKREAETQEQQTATAEIRRVISASPSDPATSARLGRAEAPTAS